MPTQFVFADENDTAVQFDAEVDGAGNLNITANGQSVLSFNKVTGHAIRVATNPGCGLPLDGDKIFVD